MGMNSESNKLVFSTTENGCVYQCSCCRAMYVEFGTVVIKFSIFGVMQMREKLNSINDALFSEGLLAEEQRALSRVKSFSSDSTRHRSNLQWAKVNSMS